ncbi:hypothetical protein Sj15T_11660 [Sphingobium sp. TA15]|nr:hypothetical protein Sj15T_11660 [Sphingobium sp. TA15]
MRGQSRSDWVSLAMDKIEYARRNAGLLKYLSQNMRTERRQLGWLEYHRAARRQRRHHLSCDLIDRPVPGRDHSDDSDRLPMDRCASARFLEGKTAECINHQLQMRRARKDMSIAGEHVGRTNLGADRLGKILLTLFIDRKNRGKQRRPLCGCR